MAPRHLSEETPMVDAIDRKVAAELATFRVELDHEFAQQHLDKVSCEHPFFIDAAQDWMHAAEKEIMQDSTIELPEARLRALQQLREELVADEEDPALIDIVDTFITLTVDEKKLGYDIAA